MFLKKLLMDYVMVYVVLTFFSFLFLKTLTFHPADQLPLVGPENGIKKRGGEEFFSSTAWLVAQTVFFFIVWSPALQF